MNWTEVTIYTTTNGIEIINGALINLGINDAVIEDASVFEDFLHNDTLNWDYYDEDLANMKSCESCIKVYLADNNQGKHLFKEIEKFVESLKEEYKDIDFGRLDIETQILNDEDWANNWKQYFKPFTVSDKIIIKPTWEEFNEPDEDKIILEIDPGMSFGTGQHHTTRLCIEQMIKYMEKDMEVLDMGCGSGILSIASLLLGAKKAAGIDIDENAVKTAKENAALNNIFEDRFSVYCGDVTEDEDLQRKIGFNRYDMIAVNIIAQIIMGMSPTFPKFLKKGGLIIASGVIKKYVDDVVKDFELLGFRILEINDSEEWVSITAELR
ncbi:50S ribosomal protein L11 methyltransferase [Sedimentibacter hydroxybenzoicus DSM 7310]|uniref:Ribosomal protein L11 methyltransferase n=1 Tax=Sedimentibacter hydroxybenzoicus DSM 7310 TaxID=1123245 RepID=A0A974BK22_SEDHY|nr:50S ribosomal protein L11 methyltransferase [Sedimentibacter hydroxybenzoicus]NYB74311.1 50S ribosomal protein L11 methyltransferase [Sedimentibacter hydroxybenzoicus DSM 7310]